jgi:ParB-like chromosome segregation protein Spo0J
MIERLDTRDVPIAELSFYPGNARRGNIARIRQSVRRLGQYRSVCVRVTDDALVILAGNHTVKAMRAEGHKTARCELIRCTDDEARRINVADNRLSDIAEDDRDALLEILSTFDGDYEATGWTEEEVAALLTPSGDPVPGDAPVDDMPAVYGVVITCDDEAQQAELLAQLDGEGYKVRALMA